MVTATIWKVAIGTTFVGVVVGAGVTALALSFAVGWLPISEDSIDTHKCDVVVLGGGFAGVYAAYQLAPSLGSKLCIIEALDRWGGRVWDVSAEAGGPVFGVGALRVTELQPTMIALANELDMVLQLQESDDELLRVRGDYFFRDITSSETESVRMCKTAFRNVTCEWPEYPDLDPDKAMLQYMLDQFNNDTNFVSKFGDFVAYITHSFGDEGLDFLRESTRYNSLFTSISTEVLAFLKNELRGMGLDPDRSYPEGGMSQYISRMVANATAHGAQTFLHEPVTRIDWDGLDKSSDQGEFVVKTANRTFSANRVVCAIDPLAFRAINGNLAARIAATQEFQNILPKKLAIVTTWWDERWWENSKFSVEAGNNLSRVVSHENCFNAMDIPTFPYGRDQNVTRAVYDDGACVDTWESLIRADNKTLLANTVMASLGQIFKDVDVPRPRALHGYVHLNAWHFQRAESPLTNKEIFDWSRRPLANTPRFSLVGEAYNMDFAAWCDGALKSSMWVLTELFEFEYPCLHDEGSPANCSSQVQSEDEVQSRSSVRSFLFG